MYGMILCQSVCDMSVNDIRDCKSLIDANFAENRFNDYTKVITYRHHYDVIGFVGIYDNLLNQLCTDIEHRKKGIAKQLLKVSQQVLESPIYLYIDKNKNNTEYLLHFYTSNSFIVCYENDVEYKMCYDNRSKIQHIFSFISILFQKIKKKVITIVHVTYQML